MVSAPRAPSALRVALRRAAHQLVDEPVVFHDLQAVPLLGPHAAELRRTPVKQHRAWSRSLRAFAVARACYAEEQLAAAVAHGVSQYCILGAGLDTFAWRNPWASRDPGLQVWEVDLPGMIAWKEKLLAGAGLDPELRTAVAADVSSADLQTRLDAAGLRRDHPTFFALLGVAPYLEAHAFRSVLELVRRYGSGSGIVLDYRLPRAALGPEERRQFDSLGLRLAAAGEPFQSWWTRDEMGSELGAFADVELLDASAINQRYFRGREDGLAVRGDAVQLVRAWLR